VAAGAFLVEGPHAVEAALRGTPETVRELFIAASGAGADHLARAAAAADVPVTRVSDRVAAALGETQHPQGVVAVVGIRAGTLETVLEHGPRLIVVLAGATDPGNTGTVIRTADAAGAEAVVLTRGSVDPYGGKCVRASAGSIFHVPLVVDCPPAAALAAIRDGGLQVFATTLDGDSIDDLDAELSAPTAWLFGSEAHGLQHETLAAADRRVRIPMPGRAESLNLAAAAAVCLFASARAHRTALGR
jgi:TrmH family RNA methyltransferase